MAEDTYHKRDLAGLLKETHRTITYWTDFVGVKPDIQASAGRGKTRIYSARNLVEFTMIKMLSQSNVKLETIRYIFQNLRAGYDIEMHSMVAAGKMPSEDLVSFVDFYTNPEWGVGQDLLYIEYFAENFDISDHDPRYVLGPMQHFRVVDENTDWEKVFRSPGPVVTSIKQLSESILWLGVLKAKAVEMYWSGGSIPGYKYIYPHRLKK